MPSLTSPDPTGPDYEQAVVARWGPSDPTVRSFWQSPVVLAEINRRVTGDPKLTPAEYFARTYCSTPRPRALSIGCGDGGLELAMLRLDVCEQLVAIDLSDARLDRVRAATPADLKDRLELVRANIETWRPDGRFDLVIANGVVHHLERLERFFDLLDDVLTDDGLLYLDEFVGPSRFQWTDTQLDIVNRLLDRLSPALRRDLVLPTLGPRPPFTRPSPDRLIAADPSEAARSAEIPELLHQRLHTVEERSWGGAIFHQFFNRIMGNFAGNDDLVRLVMEFDGILTTEGVVGSDYLWGVYVRGYRPADGEVSATELQGRVDSIEGRMVQGWVASLEEPERRIPVDVYVDHKLAAKAVADLPRPDLVRAGIGDGTHAFRVELPSWVCDGRHHAISIVVPSAGITIPVARGWEARNRGAPESTVFSFARHAPGLELPRARVLAGRDGWAFPCDDGAGSIAQLVGQLALTEADLDCHRGLLLRRARLLAELDIPYLVAITPAKASIHPEHLPTGLPASVPFRATHQLLESLIGTGVSVVDLHTPLRAIALVGGQLYYKRATHWNYYGAVIAAKALIEAVRQAGVGADDLPIESIRWVQETFEGDLAGRPTVALDEGQFRPGPPAGGAEFAAAPEEVALGIQRVVAPARARDYDAGASSIERLEPDAGPTALMLCGMDRRCLEPTLGAAFSRSLWTAGGELSSGLLDDDRPGVVLQLLDESLLVRAPYGAVA